MTNPFYTATGAPVQESRGTSPAIRNEFALLQTAMDGVFAAIDIGAASGTSTTSLLVGTGSKSFTIQAGRAFSPGQSVVLAYNVTPTTQMTGTITSYNSTTGAVVMNVTGTNGSGTYADWTLSLSPSGGATLGANVFTGVQDWATGASIASAATINLNTATGNRVHITGTTTITAVTLTRGPRTLIFDGVLTLTHHATNNNLPGGANITTAAGDRAVYESDGTTVYCTSYTRANGQPVVSAGSGLVFLSTVTGSGVSTADIETTFDGTYDVYKLFVTATFSTDNTQLRGRMKIAGAYDTGSNYVFHSAQTLSDATTYAAQASAGTTHITLSGDTGNNAAYSVDLEITLFRPASTSQAKKCKFTGHTIDGTGAASNIDGAGHNTGTGALTGFRLLPSTGTMTVTARLYGVKTS